MAWLRANVMGPDQAVWALRITARDRYSDRCWGWGERLAASVASMTREATSRTGRGQTKTFSVMLLAHPCGNISNSLSLMLSIRAHRYIRWISG